MRWSFRNLLALLSILAIFATVWGIGVGVLSYASDLVKGIIQWGALIVQFYFRKKGPDEEGQGSK